MRGESWVMSLGLLLMLHTNTGIGRMRTPHLLYIALTGVSEGLFYYTSNIIMEKSFTIFYFASAILMFYSSTSTLSE